MPGTIRQRVEQVRAARAAQEKEEQERAGASLQTPDYFFGTPEHFTSQSPLPPTPEHLGDSGEPPISTAMATTHERLVESLFPPTPEHNGDSGEPPKPKVLHDIFGITPEGITSKSPKAPERKDSLVHSSDEISADVAPTVPAMSSEREETGGSIHGDEDDEEEWNAFCLANNCNPSRWIVCTIERGFIPYKSIFDLPDVARNLIYKYVLFPNGTANAPRPRFTETHEWRVPTPALLRTSSQLRKEAIPLYYNEIIPYCTDTDPMFPWLKMIGPEAWNALPEVRVSVDDSEQGKKTGEAQAAFFRLEFRVQKIDLRKGMVKAYLNGQEATGMLPWWKKREEEERLGQKPKPKPKRTVKGFVW